ncbi:MAG: hypothetical protein JWM31_2038 [Solirubrobacterales bacterium]|nr:hypothetical protein [Solirubrobacterales bacterium]
MRMPSAADVEKATAEWLARVQDKCPEQVLGACLFAPPRNEVAGRAAALGGSLTGGLLGRRLVRAAEKAGNRDRAGGLPASFVLAVTPENVRVYESVVSRSGSAIGPEVASWERARLQVRGVDRGGAKTTLTLGLPDGTAIVCSAGTHDYTDRFVALLKTEMVPR